MGGFGRVPDGVGDDVRDVVVDELVDPFPPVGDRVNQPPRAKDPQVLRHQRLGVADLSG